MKKRLLALALCLVLATSLLPITAAAEDNPSKWVDGIKGGGIYCKEASFTIKCPPGYSVSGIEVAGGANTAWIDPQVGPYKISGYSGDIIVFIHFRSAPVMAIPITIKDDHADYDRDHICDYCEESVHVWQFTQTDSTLTATCQNGDTAPVSVSLEADSVTLPDSPFNAQVILNGITEEEIKEEFGYTISDIRYKFKAPGDSDFAPITPADGAREGTYQAAVTLSPIEVAARYARNDDGTNQGLVMEPDGSITLYTQYTAVNPQTTAQTGDNRPIEIMMASVLVFSALAAAAFIVDNKRKYSR